MRYRLRNVDFMQQRAIVGENESAARFPRANAYLIESGVRFHRFRI